MVRLLFGDIFGGGTVTIGKRLRSQYGFHSAKRPAVVQVWLSKVFCRGTGSGRFGSGRGASLNSFRLGMWFNFMFVCSQVRVQVRLRSDAGSWMFAIKFEHSFKLVLRSMRSGSLFDYGGDA